ncbi:MAG: YibE/F family protein [Lachnospiraceae bacterium]|jgi:uncharacterized membrane protein
MEDQSEQNKLQDREGETADNPAESASRTPAHPRVRFFVRWVIPCIAIAVFAVFVLWLFSTTDRVEMTERRGQTFEKGVVTQIVTDNLQADGTRVGEQDVIVRMTTGVRKGEEIEMTSSAGYLFGCGCEVGMKVIVMQSVSGDTTVSSVYSQDRGNTIIIFGLLYLALIIAVGGKKGVKSVIGLVFTFFTVIFLILPMIYRGMQPFTAAVIVCAVTTLVTMYFIGGPTRKTVSATLGTVVGCVCAGLMARFFGYCTGLSGWNVSSIESLLDLWYTDNIQVGGLLFAGILISALGATMDVAMSTSSAMEEVVRQNPTISQLELFRAGMRVGRDMMGTDSNTLILAFVGTSLNTLLLDYAYSLPYLQVINSRNIGLDIMQGLAGSFGVILCVPITVAIASVMFVKDGAKKKAVSAEADAGTAEQ